MFFQPIHFLHRSRNLWHGHVRNHHGCGRQRTADGRVESARVVVLVARRQEPGDWRWQDPSPSRLWSATHPPLRLTPPSPIDPATPMVENPGCWPATLTRRDTPRHLTHDRPITFLGHAHAPDNHGYALYCTLQTTNYERKSDHGNDEKNPKKRTNLITVCGE